MIFTCSGPGTGSRQASCNSTHNNVEESGEDCLPSGQHREVHAEQGPRTPAHALPAKQGSQAAILKRGQPGVGEGFLCCGPLGRVHLCDGLEGAGVGTRGMRPRMIYT